MGILGHWTKKGYRGLNTRLRLNKKEVQLRQMNKMNFEKQQKKVMIAKIEGKNMTEKKGGKMERNEKDEKMKFINGQLNLQE